MLLYIYIVLYVALCRYYLYISWRRGGEMRLSRSFSSHPVRMLSLSLCPDNIAAEIKGKLYLFLIQRRHNKPSYKLGSVRTVFCEQNSYFSLSLWLKIEGVIALIFYLVWNFVCLSGNSYTFPLSTCKNNRRL